MKLINNLSIDQLAERLKDQDVSYARLSKVLFIFYLMFIPVFLGVAVFEFIETEDMNEVLWAVFSSVAFAIFASLFRSYMKEYGDVDYSKPTMEMLKAAAYRYQPFQFKAIWALVGVAFIDLGMIFHFSERVDIMQTQLIFIPSVLGAAAVGLVVWYIKYKPLRDNALRLMNELKE
jgi:hypothetical protein